jgi:hypothetical protein
VRESSSQSDGSVLIVCRSLSNGCCLVPPPVSTHCMPPNTCSQYTAAKKKREGEAAAAAVVAAAAAVAAAEAGGATGEASPHEEVQTSAAGQHPAQASAQPEAVGNQSIGRTRREGSMFADANETPSRFLPIPTFN